jgi:hypothetical protein
MCRTKHHSYPFWVKPVLGNLVSFHVQGRQAFWLSLEFHERLLHFYPFAVKPFSGKRLLCYMENTLESGR